MAFTFPFNSRPLRPLLIVLPLALVLAGSYFRVLEPYELQTYDWRCQIRPARPVSPDIALIDIWNDSLDAFGAWPFERTYHADLINALKANGAKAVAFDVLFPESRPGDDAVASAAAAADNVFFSYAFYNPVAKRGKIFSDRIQDGLIPSYEKAAKGTGFVNTKADIDGKRRRTIPAIFNAGKTDYQLSFRVAMDVLGVDPKDVVVKPGRSVRFGSKLTAPLDDEGYFIINYAGPWEKTFHHYSYADIVVSYYQELNGEKPRLDLKQFKNKICFVGLTSLGSHDTNPIPIQTVYPMVGSYANVVNDILMHDFIRRLPRAANLALLVLVGALIATISSRLRPLRAFFHTLAVLAVFSGAVVVLFIYGGIWIDLFYPLAALVGLYAVTTLVRIMSEIRKRELIESELKIASQIQKSFLPETFPEVAGLGLAVYMKPAKAVGGDLYAFLKLAEDKLGVMVGDVSGKGTPAALFMAKAVSEFKFSARAQEDPAVTLANLNDSISSESTGGLFVTLTYAIFDMGRKKMTLSNGGHLPVVAVSSASPGGARLLTSEEGMPIGVMPGAAFADVETELREGDVFAFYSDGVSEARNRRKEEFGVEALKTAMTENAPGGAQAILDGTIGRLNRFMSKAEQHDDITLIVVKVGPSMAVETLS